MLSKTSALSRRLLWVITSNQDYRTELLTIDAGVEGRFLAVFSFEEEAEAFLGLSVDRDEEKKEWQSEQAEVGELVSMLVGPCAEVERVALDPLPLPLGRAMLPLVGVHRDTFLGCLVEEDEGW
jgi:hypothetical protein